MNAHFYMGRLGNIAWKITLDIKSILLKHNINFITLSNKIVVELTENNRLLINNKPAMHNNVETLVNYLKEIQKYLNDK